MVSNRLPAILVGLALAGIGAVRAIAARRVDDDPFCPLYGGVRIGSDWAIRRGLEAGDATGEIDDFGAYDRPGGAGDRDGFDSSAVHPEIRRFYEQTVEYDLAYETRWHRGFRLGARLASLATSRLEQLNLPGSSDGRVRRLESRLALVSPTADSRGAPRVWTRTDPETGAAVFVAIYTTGADEESGATYANVAVPLPRSNLSTVLYPEALEAESAGADGERGVRFTTRDPHGEGGLFLVTPLGAFRLPMAQSFAVWPAESPAAPRAPISNPDLVATHEMWLFGRQFLSIRYGLERASR